jgi:hypothetical protein
MLIPGEELIVKGSDVPLKPYVFISSDDPNTTQLKHPSADWIESPLAMRYSLKPRLRRQLVHWMDGTTNAKSQRIYSVDKKSSCLLLTGKSHIF